MRKNFIFMSIYLRIWIFFTTFAAKLRYNDQRRTYIAIKGHRMG